MGGVRHGVRAMSEQVGGASGRHRWCRQLRTAGGRKGFGRLSGPAPPRFNASNGHAGLVGATTGESGPECGCTFSSARVAARILLQTAIVANRSFKWRSEWQGRTRQSVAAACPTAPAAGRGAAPCRHRPALPPPEGHHPTMDRVHLALFLPHALPTRAHTHPSPTPAQHTCAVAGSARRPASIALIRETNWSWLRVEVGSTTPTSR